MSPELQTLLPFIISGLILLVFVIWLVTRSNRKTTVVDEDSAGPKDVLDEGADRAQRNQALIDAPTSVSQDVGQTSANANSAKVAAAGATADAEAGVSVAPTVGDPVPEPVPAADVPPPAPAPAPTAAPSGGADDLKQIKGLGPKLVTMLAELGVTRFDQIAAWSDADVERVDAQLGRFKGRITRDQWVEQAKLLSAGDQSGFSERFGQNK
ncbi:hypothetical protein [Erythrobacter ani]|uniref:Flap endonuclease-1-like 5' DNA nuclease n=1 Tax=Erythrobacter ani TaxID=2827235 RepID=A0ABS6SNB2_9SPHN|nr:hypothetical protein [Erythrobacter ani]MBV7266518.1 hypothetical protein [Erythrobacter ani]